MKNVIIAFTILFAVNAHNTFGMTSEQLKSIVTINYQESSDWQAYFAKLRNKDEIFATYFTNRPMIGSYDCTHRIFMKSDYFWEKSIDSTAFYQLRDYYRTYAK